MKTIIGFLCCLFSFITAHSQIHEIGVFLGGSNYVGDVGSTNYISPNEPALGVLYKYLPTQRHSYRLSIIKTTLSGNDLQSADPGRVERGYRFSNDLLEVSAGLEFNFLKFDLFKETGLDRFTPYTYIGLSFTFYDYLYFDQGVAKKHNSIAGKGASFPFNVGFKYNLGHKWIVAAEVGLRYTLTDNLDGSSPQIGNLKNFGNTFTNDWYVFTGITISKTFGYKKCLCSAGKWL